MSPSYEEMVRLRDAAINSGTTFRIEEFTHPEPDEAWNEQCGTYLCYAANHAVSLLEQERAHADELVEAGKMLRRFTIIACADNLEMRTHGLRLIDQWDAVVDKHAKLRGKP